MGSVDLFKQMQAEPFDLIAANAHRDRGSGERKIILQKFIAE